MSLIYKISYEDGELLEGEARTEGEFYVVPLPIKSKKGAEGKMVEFYVDGFMHHHLHGPFSCSHCAGCDGDLVFKMRKDHIEAVAAAKELEKLRISSGTAPSEVPVEAPTDAHPQETKSETPAEVPTEDASDFVSASGQESGIPQEIPPHETPAQETPQQEATVDG
jgi:hypothetical protein